MAKIVSVLADLPFAFECKRNGIKDVLAAANGLSTGSLEKILGGSQYVNLDLVTRVKPADKNLIEKFKGINKKYATCCPIEDFVYLRIEIYSKSFCSIIPFDAKKDDVLKAACEIETLLKGFETEYQKRNRTKFKYKMSAKF